MNEHVSWMYEGWMYEGGWLIGTSNCPARLTKVPGSRNVSGPMAFISNDKNRRRQKKKQKHRNHIAGAMETPKLLTLPPNFHMISWQFKHAASGRILNTEFESSRIRSFKVSKHMPSTSFRLNKGQLLKGRSAQMIS